MNSPAQTTRVGGISEIRGEFKILFYFLDLEIYSPCVFLLHAQNGLKIYNILIKIWRV
jgi:hypothetical protein